MTEKTSIKISRETRDMLKEESRPLETYDSTLRRLFDAVESDD
jgi:hypothetical protein